MLLSAYCPWSTSAKSLSWSHWQWKPRAQTRGECCDRSSHGRTYSRRDVRVTGDANAAVTCVVVTGAHTLGPWGTGPSRIRGTYRWVGHVVAEKVGGLQQLTGSLEDSLLVHGKGREGREVYYHEVRACQMFHCTSFKF